MSAKIFITLVVVCAFFGGLSAFDVKVDSEPCGKICPLYYSPVCGSDGRSYREFSNECELKALNCQVQRSLMRPFVLTHLDMCRTELVSGLDNLMVKLGNVNMKKPECMKKCNRMYEPVCISNGKYRSLATNKCIMEIVNCAVGDQDVFKIVRNGSC